MHERVEDKNRRKLIDGVVAGLTATLVMTGLFFAAPALGGARVQEPAARAVVALRAHPLLALAAFGVHFLYGSLAGGLFAVGARSVTIGRAVVYGLGLWGVAVAVYAPLVGLGFVVSHQPALAVLAIPAHLAYGVALGALAPKGEIVQPLTDERPQLDDRFEALA